MNLRNRHGFTLLELLIAILSSVVILIILFAAMRLGYKSEARYGTERANTKSAFSSATGSHGS